DKKTEIDLVQIQVMKNFAGFQSWIIPEEIPFPLDQKLAMEIFIDLFKKYPYEISKVANQVKNSPFANSTFQVWLKDKKDREEKAALVLYLMQATDNQLPFIRPSNYFTFGYDEKLEQFYPCKLFFSEKQNM